MTVHDVTTGATGSGGARPADPRGGSGRQGAPVGAAPWYADVRTVPVLLVLAVLLTYLPGILGGRFHFDDFHSLRDNPSVRDLANLPRFYADPKLWSAEPGNVMYRPTLLVTFAIDHALWDYRASGWILTNALLHGLVAALTWSLARRLGLSPLAAALAGFVTALHPVHSEVVNYVSARSESLAAALLLLALHAHLAARTASGAARAARTALACACFALSLTAKETTAGFFLAVPLLELLVPVRGEGTRDRVVRAVSAAVLYGVVFAAMMALRADLLGHATARVHLWRNTGADPRTGGQVSILDNVLKTQSRVVAIYHDLLLRPVRLTVDHDVERTIAWKPSAILSLALHAGVVAAALRAAVRGARVLPLAVGWFWLFLAPSVAFPLNVVMNEHRLYLPGIAVALLAGAALGRVAELLPRTRRAALLVPFGCFAVLSAHRSAEWRDDELLWRIGVVRAPQSARAWQHLGAVVHAKRNDLPPGEGAEILDEAIAHYRRSESLFPNHYDNQLNLGLAHLERFRLRGDPADLAKSLAAYDAAEDAIGGEVVRTRLCRALVLTEMGRTEEAIEIITRARRDDDSRTTLYDDMEARARRRAGDHEGARRAMERVIAIEVPEGRVDGLLTLAWWRMESGDRDGAFALIQRAISVADRSPTEFRPYLYAMRWLTLTGGSPLPVLEDAARKRGWSAQPDEVAWVLGGATPGAVRTGTRGMPTYGGPR